MADMNSFNFTGRITADTELKVLSNGNKLCSFTVANNTGYGDNKKVNWVKCSLWGDKAQSLHPYLRKGQLVAVSGELSLNNYTTREGSQKSELQVFVKDFNLLGGSSSGEVTKKDDIVDKSIEEFVF